MNPYPCNTKKTVVFNKTALGPMASLLAAGVLTLFLGTGLAATIWEQVAALGSSGRTTNNRWHSSMDTEG